MEAGVRLYGANIGAGYGKHRVLSDVNLSIPDGKITVLIGANACGKSTLLKAVARLLKPSSGVVYLDHKPLHKISPKHLARTLGIMPQSPIAPEGITVAELVSRGRFPYQNHFSIFRRKDQGSGMTGTNLTKVTGTNLNTSDFEAIEEAMKTMSIVDLADRDISELSGGQRQRVWIAMALAQQTDILLLDEPTTFLDIAHQIEILGLLKRLNSDRGTTLVMVLHDINVAARYADHMVAVKKGAIVDQGPPSQIICPELIEEVFDLKSIIIEDPITKTPLIIPK